MPRLSSLPVFLFILVLTGIYGLFGVLFCYNDVSMLSLKSLQVGVCTKPETFDIAVTCRNKFPDLNGNVSRPQTDSSLTRLGSLLAAARCSERGVLKQANKHYYNTRNSCLASIWRKTEAVLEHENIDDVWLSNHFLDVSRKMVELCLHTCPCEEVQAKGDAPLLVGLTKVGVPQQASTSHRILRRKNFDSSANENPLPGNSPSFNTVPSDLYPNRPGIQTGGARSAREEQEFERFVRESSTVDLLRKMQELRAQELHGIRRLTELEARLRQAERHRPSATPSYSTGGALSRRDRLEIRETSKTSRGGVTTERRTITKSDKDGAQLTPRETAVISRAHLAEHHLARRGSFNPVEDGDLRHKPHIPLTRIEGFSLPTNRIEGFPLPTNRSPSQSLRYSGITCLKVEIPPQHDLDTGREIPWPTVRTGHVIRFLSDETICRMQCECGDHTNWRVVCDWTVSLEKNTFSGNSRVQRICAEGCQCSKPPARLIDR